MASQKKLLTLIWISLAVFFLATLLRTTQALAIDIGVARVISAPRYY